MADNLQASEPLGAEPAPLPRRAGRGPWRTVIFPLLVIAAIAAVIWWIDYRPGGGSSSSTGERYGPVELPPALVAAGADVSPKEGALAPDFLLERLDGGDLRLSDYRGQPLVVNFWATWCAPCRREIPQFVSAYDRFRDQGLVIIGVNLQESKSIVQNYADDFGMKFPIAIDRSGEVAKRYRLLGLPMTFFIDRQGVVRSVFAGPFLEESRGTNVQGAIGASDLEQRIAEIME
ncbi:MAG: TlpA family protein disulfide reductase [Chloroflexi bacterium]|nr:TlpA family protein disulfide reductase [Chloroflexota bacterium]